MSVYSSSPAYPGAPQNASADVLNSTSIAVSWSSPSAEYGAVLQYNLSCRSPVLNSSLSLSSNTTRQQMTRLLPYTTYNCCVWAVNSHGWGPGACIQVTTPPSGTEVNIIYIYISMVTNGSYLSADSVSSKLLCVCGQLNKHCLEMEPTCSWPV